MKYLLLILLILCTNVYADKLVCDSYSYTGTCVEECQDNGATNVIQLFKTSSGTIVFSLNMCFVILGN